MSAGNNVFVHFVFGGGWGVGVGGGGGGGGLGACTPDKLFGFEGTDSR